jgi:hypothetical protein
VEDVDESSFRRRFVVDFARAFRASADRFPPPTGGAFVLGVFFVFGFSFFLFFCRSAVKALVRLAAISASSRPRFFRDNHPPALLLPALVPIARVLVVLVLVLPVLPWWWGMMGAMMMMMMMSVCLSVGNVFSEDGNGRPPVIFVWKSGVSFVRRVGALTMPTYSETNTYISYISCVYIHIICTCRKTVHAYI